MVHGGENPSILRPCKNAKYSLLHHTSRKISPSCINTASKTMWHWAGRASTATVAATVCSGVFGAFRVGWMSRRREPGLGVSRQIFEKAGKTLKRNGGDDGARTHDLRRDRSAICTPFPRTCHWDSVAILAPPIEFSIFSKLGLGVRRSMPLF